MTFAYGVTLPVLGVALLSVLRPGWGESALYRRTRLYLWCVAGFPLAFFTVASLFQNVAGYYLFFLSPFVFLMAGEALGRFFYESRTYGRWIAVAGVLGGLLAGDVLYFTAEQGGRENWKGAMAELAAQIESDTRILMTMPEVGQYYLRAPGVRWEKLTYEMIQVPSNAIRREREGQETVIVVDTNNFQTLDPSRAFRRWLDAHAHRIVYVFAYARASDRTIEAFRLDYASKKTELP
jgi:hypothetical protein